MVKISGILSLGKNLTKSVSEASHVMPTRVSNPFQRTLSFGSAEAATSVVTTSAKKLPETAKFYSYPENLQKDLVAVVERLNGSAQHKSLATFLNNLMRYCPEHELVAKLLENQNLLKYSKSKCGLNKIFKDVVAKDFQTKEIILENLAFMETFNPESFNILKKSKGFKEIIGNRLDIAYLKDVKPTQKIDENFFYNMFDDIEKAADKRLLSIKGLDKDAASRLIKASDDEICKNSNSLEEILNLLEKSENPELTNRILKSFEITPKNASDVKDIIKLSSENPELVSKIIQLKGIPSGSVRYLLLDLSRDTRAISDDMLDYIIKYQQKNADICSPFAVGAANNFLFVTNNDEQLLKTLLDKLASNKSKNVEVANFLDAISEYNKDFFKHNLSNGKLDKETLVKLNLMRNYEKASNPENWSLVDKAYEETYLPLKKSLETNPEYARYFGTAEVIAEKRLVDPEIYQKLEDLGVIDMIKAGKVNPRIVYGFRNGMNLTPEVIEDLKILQNNETIIKKFDNFDKIFSKTKEGDVISVKGQLYLNLGGRIERWNMSEEKFNELFPLVDRFTGLQGVNDCYLITALDTLYRNPKSRGIYYKMFEQKGNDILVTIPAYKDFNGTVTFKNGQINLSADFADAAKHVQMLEQTYARTALRTGFNIPIGQNSLITDDLDYLVKRNFAGQSGDVMQEVLVFNNNVRKNKLSRKIYTKTVNKPEDLQLIQNNFDKNGSNPRFLFNLGLHKRGTNYGHAIQVRAYNPETKTFTLVDPMRNGLEYERTFDEIKDEIYRVWTTVLK